MQLVFTSLKPVLRRERAKRLTRPARAELAVDGADRPDPADALFSSPSIMAVVVRTQSPSMYAHDVDSVRSSPTGRR